MKKILCSLIFIVLLMSTKCFAGDAELYALVNGKSFAMTANKTAYTLKFAGFDDEEFSGTAYLLWPDAVEIDGYRYQIQRKLIMPFMVWGGSVGIDAADSSGNITTFEFTIDYENALVQVGELRFPPVEE